MKSPTHRQESGSNRNSGSCFRLAKRVRAFCIARTAKPAVSLLEKFADNHPLESVTSLWTIADALLVTDLGKIAGALDETKRRVESNVV